LFHALDPTENEDAQGDLIGNALVCRQRLQFLEGALVEGHIDRRAVFKCALNEYIKRRGVMPRVAVDDNKRMNLRVRPEQKATLVRAAALRNTDLTDFVLQPALREAKRVIEEAERITLSERDSLMVLKLLEKPPAPNARLRKALASLPKAK
jgi:uncharacterized protein (DUF1778 family)